MALKRTAGGGARQLGAPNKTSEISALQRRQSMRLRNSGRVMDRGEIVARLADLLAAEARYLEDNTGEQEPARASVANLVYASEALRQLL